MLKQVKLFLKGLAMDKDDIAKEVVKKTTKEERSTYRIWVFGFNVVVLTLFCMAFLPGSPCFVYCLYKSYNWMKDGNKKDS